MTSRVDQSASWDSARDRFQTLLGGQCHDRSDDNSLLTARNTGIMDAAGLVNGLMERAKESDQQEVTALLTLISGMITDLVYKVDK